jgi:hypothetical protein
MRGIRRRRALSGRRGNNFTVWRWVYRPPHKLNTIINIVSN